MSIDTQGIKISNHEDCELFESVIIKDKIDFFGEDSIYQVKKSYYIAILLYIYLEIERKNTSFKSIWKIKKLEIKSYDCEDWCRS